MTLFIVNYQIQILNSIPYTYCLATTHREMNLKGIV